MHLWRAGELITADKLTSRVLTGRETIEFTTSVGGYYRGSVTVVFPDGFFTATPAIVVTPDTSVPGVFLGAGVTADSKTGFTLTAARQNTVPTSINWLAIQVTEA